MASRMLPWAIDAISARPSAAAARPSCSAIQVSRPAISASLMRRKSKRWQRETIVAGSLCASVVQRMKRTCSGGSSSVLSRALKASGVSWWASSMM